MSEIEPARRYIVFSVDYDGYSVGYASDPEGAFIGRYADKAEFLTRDRSDRVGGEIVVFDLLTDTWSRFVLRRGIGWQEESNV